MASPGRLTNSSIGLRLKLLRILIILVIIFVFDNRSLLFVNRCLLIVNRHSKLMSLLKELYQGFLGF